MILIEIWSTCFSLSFTFMGINIVIFNFNGYFTTRGGFMENKVSSYKKSYREFLLLIIGYLVVAILVGFLFRDFKKLPLVIMFISGFFIFMLSFLIVVLDRAYWYNGIDFKKAKEVGRKRRIEFSFKHFKRAAFMFFLMSIYMIFSFVFKFSTFLDVFLSSVLIVMFPISTINIKL